MMQPASPPSDRTALPSLDTTAASVLGMAAWQRLIIVFIAVIALWLAVGWALDGGIAAGMGGQ